MKSKISLRRNGGFTLVELLVSITILSIILLSLAQAMGFVSNLWVNGVGMVDNFSKARNVLGVMDRDIQAMVMRPDTAAFVGSDAATPACAFYTNVQGSPGADVRTVSLVQYILNPLAATTTAGETTLGRISSGMNFFSSTAGGVTPILETTPGVSPTTLDLAMPTVANTDVLATGVIQFQWQFVDASGNVLNPPYTVPGATGPTPPTTPFFYDYTAPSAATNPRAIVVSLVVLSNGAYQFALQNTSLMTKIQADFPTTPPAANESYSQVWSDTLNPTTGVFDATLPSQIRGGLEVFQRYIPLPAPAP